MLKYQELKLYHHSLWLDKSFTRIHGDPNVLVIDFMPSPGSTTSLSKLRYSDAYTRGEKKYNQKIESLG